MPPVIAQDLGKSHNFQASLIANNLAFFSTEELSYLTELDTEDYGKDGSAVHKGKGLSGMNNHNLLRSIEGKDLYYDEEESKPRISNYDEEESKPRISRGQGALENLLCGEPNSLTENPIFNPPKGDSVGKTIINPIISSAVEVSDPGRISPRCQKKEKKFNLLKCERKRSSTCPSRLSTKIQKDKNLPNDQNESQSKDKLSSNSSRDESVQKTSLHSSLSSFDEVGDPDSLPSQGHLTKPQKKEGKFNLPKCERKRSRTCPSSLTATALVNQSKGRTSIKSPRRQRKSLGMQRISKRASGKEGIVDDKSDPSEAMDSERPGASVKSPRRLRKSIAVHRISKRASGKEEGAIDNKDPSEAADSEKRGIHARSLDKRSRSRDRRSRSSGARSSMKNGSKRGSKEDVAKRLGGSDRSSSDSNDNTPGDPSEADPLRRRSVRRKRASDRNRGSKEDPARVVVSGSERSSRSIPDLPVEDPPEPDPLRRHSVQRRRARNTPDLSVEDPPEPDSSPLRQSVQRRRARDRARRSSSSRRRVSSAHRSEPPKQHHESQPRAQEGNPPSSPEKPQKRASTRNSKFSALLSVYHESFKTFEELNWSSQPNMSYTQSSEQDLELR